ncbi:MAG: signal peptidase I [Chloroflexota bacterium]
MRRFAGFVVTAGLLVGWWVNLGPPIVGGPATYVVVRGDSMVPTYETGALVIVHASERYGIGDVVAYRVPEGELGAGLLVIHRIVDGDAAAGYVLQGDNNPAPDPWRPRARDIAGSAWLAIPGVGRAISFLLQPAALAALASALMVGWLVRRSPRQQPSM